MCIRDRWDKIAVELPEERQTKVFSLKRLLSIAASAVVLVSMGVLIGLQLAPKNGGTIADIAPEYQEIEQFYSNKVNYQLGQLAKYPASTDPLLQEDLADLDQWLEQLQEELIEVPKSQKEAVINSIIENYKTKLSILESIMEHAKEHKELGEHTHKHKSI